jgi:hypothetical protein
MRIDIQSFVFKHNGAIHRVAATHKTDFAAQGNIVARQHADAELIVEFNDRKYRASVRVVLALDGSRLREGILSTIIEQRDVYIHPDIPAEVLSFEDIEYAISYSVVGGEQPTRKKSNGKEHKR